jgi:hypothetical protein
MSKKSFSTVKMGINKSSTVVPPVERMWSQHLSRHIGGVNREMIRGIV